jgi:hypothetical protein
MTRRRAAASLAALLALLAAPAARATLPEPRVLRAWIEEMKASPRGPFELIRWFCNDGTIRPARAGCSGHGDGVQHGDWNERARELRRNGYAIANVLVALEPMRFTGPDADLETWKQIVLERFLVGWDEGWIFRGAYGYRGALQIEDEEAAARRLVLSMLADPRWRDPTRFLLLRESARLLPLSTDQASAAAVRARAMNLAQRDSGFAALRAKIHSFPDAGDSQRVLDYASRVRPGLSSEYEGLAREIDALYAPQGAAQAVLELAALVDDRHVARELREKSDEFRAEVNPGLRVAAAAKLMRMLRERFPKFDEPEVALTALLTSLALEREIYASGAESIVKVARSSTRRSRLSLLAFVAESAYGAGFLGTRQLREVEAAVKSIEARNPALREYREVVQYLTRVPEWTGRQLELVFGPVMQRWAALEPQAPLYAADRLRGSPLLFYSEVSDGLVLDVNQLAGVTHEVFGERIGGGLRALNPGLARGVLRVVGEDPLREDGIYLMPETVADLEPVAGILTLGEGSSLSHVQLLARNLGIPNVVVHEKLVPRVRSHRHARAVMAVSPGGVVRLAPDSPQWDAVFGAPDRPREVLIQPDLAKLDLTVTDFLPLSSLRALDSGRVCGPKGANLGELRFAFGRAVPDGFVIPFGAFRRVLERPIEPGGPPAFEWMRARYDEIQAARDPDRRRRLASEMLARVRAWLAEVDLGAGFEAQLRWQLEQHFGRDGSYGVFVRSDTNVEDLPGFSGAGLNQTVPNVVGFEAILAAIREVWASPFTERSYAWRQAHMADPEYVFPAVVVQRAFPSEKSGVLVTVDVESGDPRWLTVAVNEGVGGAVDGQAAESLLVDARRGAVRLLAPASAPTRKVLAPGGGIAVEPASGREVVLERGEIKKLVALAREAPAKIPSLRDPVTGETHPADIEFAFRDGRLAILQIRPYNESRGAQRSQYLAQLDEGLRARGDQRIWIGGVPGRDAPAPQPAAAPQPEAPARTAAGERSRR